MRRRRKLLAGGSCETIPYPAISKPVAPVSLAQAQTNTGWSSLSGAVLATEAYPEAAPSGRTTGVSLTVTGGDTFAGMRTTTLVTAGKKLDDYLLAGFWIWWPELQEGSVNIQFSSDNFATKIREFGFSYPGQVAYGWNQLKVRPDGVATPGGGSWVVTGGMATSEVINAIGFTMNNAGGAKVYFDNPFSLTALPTIGNVSLGFDAFGTASVVTLALPILNALGMKGFWHGDAFLVDVPGTARDYADQVYAAGWDVVSQGGQSLRAHTNYTVSPTLLAPDIDSSRIVWDARYPRGRDFWSWAFSASTSVQDAVLVAKSIRGGRSASGWQIKPNEYNIGRMISGGAVNLGGLTLTQAKAVVDHAEAHGESVMIFTHGLTAGGTGTTPPADPLLWYADDWQALATYIKAKVTGGTLNADPPTIDYARRKDAYGIA